MSSATTLSSSYFDRYRTVLVTFQCKELYFCVKDAMEKAAARNNGKVPGKEIGWICENSTTHWVCGVTIQRETGKNNSWNDFKTKWILPLAQLIWSIVLLFISILLISVLDIKSQRPHTVQNRYVHLILSIVHKHVRICLSSFWFEFCSFWNLFTYLFFPFVEIWYYCKVITTCSKSSL